MFPVQIYKTMKIGLIWRNKTSSWYVNSNSKIDLFSIVGGDQVVLIWVDFFWKERNAIYFFNEQNKTSM